MVDHLLPDQRSWNMRRIRSKDTKPELIVRSQLHSLGFRFRLHSNKLQGKPDIVLKKYKTVIFCHGCFWHQHPGCKKATFPKTNKEYWKKKFARNKTRFDEVKNDLISLGWKVLIIWECQTKHTDNLKKLLIKELKGISK